MFKKTLLRILVLLSACVLTAQAEWKFEVTTTADSKGITMLVVPRDATSVKIANDIAQHYPILLVCYQQTDDLVKTHAWNGERWIDVPTEDYTNGVFFAKPPKHAILVETEEAPAPDVLIPDGTWCASGNRLIASAPCVMIHLLGRYFNFPYRLWKDFSRRYELPFEKINPAFINTRLWHHYGEDVFKKRKLHDSKADLDKWLYLDITPPEPVIPIEILEDLQAVAPAEIPAEKPVEIIVPKPAETPVKAEEVEAAPAPKTEPEVIKVDVAVEETPAPVEETAEEPVEKPVKEPAANTADLPDAPEPVAEVIVDPFTATEIPAAEVILPPLE